MRRNARPKLESEGPGSSGEVVERPMIAGRDRLSSV